MDTKKTLDQIKGCCHEKRCADVLRLEYDRVIPWKEVPKNILEKFDILIEKNEDTGDNIDINEDIGIDLVAIKDNECTLIQCKNYTNNVTIKDIAGFSHFINTYGHKNKKYMLCYSNDVCARIKKDYSRQTENRTMLRRIPIDNTLIEYEALHAFECKELRYYQKEAVELLSDKTKFKCILAMPCGLGKTFTVSAIAKNYDTVIILAPLKKLTSDLLKNMSIFLGDEYGKVLLSSDKNGIRDVGNAKTRISENKKNIIACTYDSADVLIEIFGELKKVIVLIDEFHNLSKNNLENKNDNIFKILGAKKKKIFMYATQKEIECDAM